MFFSALQMVAGDLTRNLGFSFATIVAITLLLIADLRVSLVVLASVVMTVANVAGYLAIDYYRVTHLVG